MSYLRKITLALALAGGTILPAGATEDEERMAILAVVQKTFDALRTSDVDVWREVLMEEGIMLSYQPAPEGEAGDLLMRVRHNVDFLNGLQPREITIIERFTEEPTVLIRGPIAVVWGEYDLWVDGEFGHCGVDSIDMAKVEGKWKIANLIWTQEVENCPTSSGPAPQ